MCRVAKLAELLLRAKSRPSAMVSGWRNRDLVRKFDNARVSGSALEPDCASESGKSVTVMGMDFILLVQDLQPVFADGRSFMSVVCGGKHRLTWALYRVRLRESHDGQDLALVPLTVAGEQANGSADCRPPFRSAFRPPCGHDGVTRLP